jgi:NAD dependent epimerase/dehydratase family enzyme
MFVSDGILYIILRDHWCDIVLNVHAPTEVKIDDKKGRFYEELEPVFNKFPKYHMRILLGDFNVMHPLHQAGAGHYLQRVA